MVGHSTAGPSPVLALAPLFHGEDGVSRARAVLGGSFSGKVQLLAAGGGTGLSAMRGRGQIPQRGAAKVPLPAEHQLPAGEEEAWSTAPSLAP